MDRIARTSSSIQIPFRNTVIESNVVTEVVEEEGALVIGIEPRRPEVYQPQQGEPAVRYEVYATDEIVVQELGLPGQAVRYRVAVKRARYADADAVINSFTLPIPGVSLRLGMSKAVIEKTLYFMVDRNESLDETVTLLWDLYRVKTSTSALDRIKRAASEGLPTLGQIVQMLDAVQPITQLHIDEYKAKGKRGWELVVRDEHGRLLVVLYLKKRSERKFRVVLRWLRMLGLRIRVFYVDGWSAYLAAIAAIFPQAKVQYDYFHIIQNIWRHMYKEFTCYRKRLKNAKCEPEKQRLLRAMHKRLWKNRYLLFTHPRTLTPEDKQRLQDLLAEHEDSILPKIVEFMQRIWDLFEKSPKKITAQLKRLDLVAEGWASLGDHFAKAMRFLAERFKNMIAHIDDSEVQRNSLAETTVRMVRRIETVRQGFKSVKGRSAHFKLWIFRRHLRPLHAST